MIKGLQKTSLIDYPGKVACTIFFGGCSVRCGYCYNKDLVEQPELLPDISEETLLAFLHKRKNVLEGVCITGGEPTLYADLPSLCGKIKQLGLLIKLDTNGTNPAMIARLLQKGLVDYFAMDIKSSLDTYDKVAGPVDVDKIQKSIQWIMESGVDYEFRSTVVPDVFTDDVVEKIGSLLDGAKRYYLQQFRQIETCISPRYRYMHALPLKKLLHFKELLNTRIEQVDIRT